jgi:hypothetical protein
MDLQDIHRRLPIQHVLHFAWVYQSSSDRDDMTNKCNLHQPKFALAEFGVQLVSSELFQYQSQMFLIFFFCLAENHNVIDENHKKPIQVLHKHLIHEIHEIGWGIRKSEGHHSILIESIPGTKCCLWDI